MAGQINLSLSTYMTDFTNGQVNLSDPLRTGANYVEYDVDFDTNFATLRTTINQMIAEINAVQGPNAGLGVDILTFDDPARSDSGDPNDAAGANRTGFVGEAVFSTTLSTTTTTDDTVTITAGLVIIEGLAVSSLGATLIEVSAAGTGDRFVAVDANGTLTLHDTAAQKSADLWHFDWDGTSLSNGTRQQQFFFDGDEYEAQRARPAIGSSPATFPAVRFDATHRRVEAIERLLAGFTTDNDGNSFGQQAIDAGTEALPGLVFNGDPDNGIRRPGADQFSISTNATERLLLDATGNLDLPTNSRVKALRTATISIADATPTNVPFTATDEFDIGGWHNPGASPADEQCIVPTGADGLYHVVFQFDWEVPPTRVRDFIATITVDTVAIPGVVYERILWTTEKSSDSTSGYVVLAAGETVRGAVTQSDTGGTLALTLDSASLSIVKIA